MGEENGRNGKKWKKNRRGGRICCSQAYCENLYLANGNNDNSNGSKRKKPTEDRTHQSTKASERRIMGAIVQCYFMCRTTLDVHTHISWCDYFIRTICARSLTLAPLCASSALSIRVVACYNGFGLTKTHHFQHRHTHTHPRCVCFGRQLIVCALHFYGGHFFLLHE